MKSSPKGEKISNKVHMIRPCAPSSATTLCQVLKFHLKQLTPLMLSAYLSCTQEGGP